MREKLKLLHLSVCLLTWYCFQRAAVTNPALSLIWAMRTIPAPTSPMVSASTWGYAMLALLQVISGGEHQRLRRMRKRSKGQKRYIHRFVPTLLSAYGI